MKEQTTNLTVGYTPCAGNNAYVSRQMEILTGLATVTTVPSLRALLRHPTSLLQKQFDVVILNWTDNTLVTQSGTPSLMGILKFLAWSLGLRMVSRATLFVRHNTYPHHTKARYRKLVTKLVDGVELLFSHTVTHSGHNVNNRRSYVPHPLFHDTTQVSAAVSKGDEEGYYIAFGRIMPYKHLDDLMRSFPADKRLIIAGPCPDPQYLEYLHTLARPNIDIHARHIPEEMARQWVAQSSGLVLAHSDGDIIVSGSYFFAAGLGVPVYSLRSPFFDWLITTLGVPGLFTATTLSELFTKLDPNHQHQRAAILRYARQHFSEAEVSRAWSEVFSAL